jgi:hypothetical protein
VRLVLSKPGSWRLKERNSIEEGVKSKSGDQMQEEGEEGEGE